MQFSYIARMLGGVGNALAVTQRDGVQTPLDQVLSFNNLHSSGLFEPILGGHPVFWFGTLLKEQHV